MLDFLKTCDKLFYTFGAEQVAVHNEFDRVQAKAIKEGTSFEESEAVRPSTNEAKWIASTKAKNGVVSMSVIAKTLGYVAPAGFIVNNWKTLHSELAYFEKSDPTLSIVYRNKRYPCILDLADKTTAFKYQVVGLDFCLKNPEYGVSYAQKRFLLNIPNTQFVQITADNFGKLSRVASCLSADSVKLLIKDKCLYAQYGLESSTANTASLLLGEINAEDSLIGKFKLDLILGLRRAFGDDVPVYIRKNVLYAGFDNDDYSGVVSLIGT